jgi:hypothetical protein
MQVQRGSTKSLSDPTAIVVNFQAKQSASGAARSARIMPGFSGSFGNGALDRYFC